MLLNEIRVVSENGNHGRRRLDLCRVIQLDLAPRSLRRLPSSNNGGESRIHLRRADALVSLGVYFQQQLEDLRYSLPADSGCEHEWHELEEWRLLLRFLLELGRGVVLFLFQIPLV